MPYEYTRSDAAREEYEERVDSALEDITSPIVKEVQEMDEEAYYPHPWTYERSLLAIWQEDGDDGLQEYLNEEYRDEAEEHVKDSGDAGPCCYQFSCPCGNSNGNRE